MKRAVFQFLWLGSLFLGLLYLVILLLYVVVAAAGWFSFTKGDKGLDLFAVFVVPLSVLGVLAFFWWFMRELAAWYAARYGPKKPQQPPRGE